MAVGFTILRTADAAQATIRAASHARSRSPLIQSQIAALGKPDKDATLLDRLLANGRASAASNQAVAQAAQSGDVKAFKAADAARPPSGTALAKQFGFKVCAQHG